MTTCRGCGQNIIWIKTKAGKMMPCDPQPHSIKEGPGDMILLTAAGEIIRGTPRAYDNGADKTGYISHFSTCPAADTFRRR